MVGEQNKRLPGVDFHRGLDVTAEMLNGLQQYLARELVERTRDFIKYPGWAWGFKIGRIDGQSVTITQGVGFDQFGVRLYHDKDAAYKLAFPAATSTATAGNVGYLCVRAYPTAVQYQVHPYDGTRQPTEIAMGVQFYIDLAANLYTDAKSHLYAAGNNGLVLAKLTIVGATYQWDDATATSRSPNLTMHDGQA